MISSLYKKIANSFAVLSVLSLCLPLSSLSAYDQQCCESPREAECCSLWDSNAACWIGGAILGAAAGAGTGYAASNRGDRGRTGDPGPVGPAGTPGTVGPTGPAFTFPEDTGETLTFNYTLNATLGLVGSSATPYVALPDGTVIQGAPVGPLVLGLNVLPSLVVADPLFGAYEAGVQRTSGVVALVADLLTTVNATRNGSTTIIANATPVIGVIGSQGQSAEQFVYGAPAVP